MMLEGDWPEDAWIDEDDLPAVKPWYCEKCGNPVGGAGSVERPCRAGNCWEICCAKCGFHWAGFGPVGCPCQSRDPKIRRIRQMYRARAR